MTKPTSKNFQNWISGLTEEQFDEFCKTYIEIEWSLSNVILCNGTGDGGIDVRYFENNTRVKIPLQITIQENHKTKIENELPKIYKLIAHDNYAKEYYFLYNKVISDTKIREYEKLAKRTYGITLKIIDANEFASILNQEDYQKLRSILRDF